MEQRSCPGGALTLCLEPPMTNGPETTVSFERSTRRMLNMVLLGCLFCFVGYQLTQDWAVAQRGAYAAVVGWLGLAVFGTFLTAIVYRWIRLPKTILELSATGFLDRRLSNKVIPWRDIAGISQKTVRGQASLGLKVTEEGMQQLRRNLPWPTQIRLSIGPERDTLWVSIVEFDASFDDLWACTTRFLQEHNPSALPEPSPPSGQ